MYDPIPTLADRVRVASLAQLEALEAAGRRALGREGYARLATTAAALHAAVFSLQGDGVRGADAVDLDALEDACALFQRLAAEAEGAA